MASVTNVSSLCVTVKRHGGKQRARSRYSFIKKSLHLEKPYDQSCYSTVEGELKY